jgi:hypothetical protein
MLVEIEELVENACAASCSLDLFFFFFNFLFVFCCEILPATKIYFVGAKATVSSGGFSEVFETLIHAAPAAAAFCFLRLSHCKLVAENSLHSCSAVGRRCSGSVRLADC